MPYKDINKRRENNRASYRRNREKRLLAHKKWNAANKEKRLVLTKRWAKEHPEKIREIRARTLLKNRESIKARGREYAKKHKKQRKITQKLYIQKNKDKVRAKERVRYWTDTNARMARRLRSRLYDALKGGFKVGSAVENLGCSIEELKTHLSSLFLLGMSWDNYEQFGWHIDHKTPLSLFDLSNPEQLKIACHYTNLQPMWWKENLSKQNKLICYQQYQ